GPVIVAVNSLRAEGATGLQIPGDAPLDYTFDGGIAIAEASIEAPERNGMVLGATGATVEEIRFSESMRQFAAKAISINGATAQATVNALPKGPPPEDAPPRSGRILELELPYAVIVDRIVLADGTAKLMDAGATPPLAVQLEDLAVELTSVNTTQPQATTIAISSKLQGTGRLAVDGTANLLGEKQAADLTVTLAGVPLPPYDAVAGYYAGYKVDTGRLSSTMPIRIDGPTITGELDFTFANIDLGEKVESPVAPDLPLDLGVSILKDGEGNVTGKVTFEGDMTSPSFNFGDLVFRAIFGLVGKIITAPFQLLAGAFGGGDADISFVAFEPGDTDLVEGEIGKLDILAEALLDRAQLHLGVVGHATSDTDVAALRSSMLREAMLEQLRSASPTLTTLSDDLYRQGVITRYSALPAPATEPTFEQMEQAVLATVEVPLERRIDLAQRRAARVAEILLAEHGLPADRVSTSVPDGDALDAESPRASFELK
ncbi:MAG: DUF748 domain-containing protein, partial [Phycisphaerales bacterium]|nr:DUF748 domain-containing protein [Phycisphaerales bacterium]